MKNSTLFLVGLICYLSLVLGGMGKGKHYEIDFSPTSCSVPASVKANIQSHDEAVQEIVSQITHKLYKGMAFQELAKYVDRFGSRMTGSEALEASIDYLRDEMQKIPVFRNVHTENVTVPKWLRGPESARLLEPWEKDIEIMAYQYSVSTVPTVLTAEVVPIYESSEMTETPEKFAGKIVACVKGCSLIKLGDLGALAVLKGSGFGLYTPHRGGRASYSMTPGHIRIPVAAVTNEDMTLFDQVHKLGKKMVLRLSMTEPETVNVTSRNLVGEYFGSTLPEKLLGVTAHMDSWDVGQGAQDDGFGVIFGILMVRLFNDFALRPRRTIRAIFFTGEEIGEKGSRAYAEAHADEMHRFQGAFEADVGCEVNGLLFHGGQDLGCMLYEILKMIQPLIPNVTMAYREHWSSDIDNFMHHQVPTIGLRGGPRYRWFTHAEPDTMTSINSHQLDRCFALYAATAYVVANMNADLPRESQPKPTPPPPAGQRSGNQIGPISNNGR